jgi:hypothetical protein
MRIVIAVFGLVLSSAAALAQNQPASPSGNETAASKHSTGRTVVPEEKGLVQPQGQTGPINTTTGGPPAESPQGQTPPGMQAAPEGSSKTIVDPKK